MATTKKSMKANFDVYKEGSIEILLFGKKCWDNCGFDGISAKILEFCNHGNKHNLIKIVFDANKECSNKNIGFWKII